MLTRKSIFADTSEGIIGITGMIGNATAIILASTIVTRILQFAVFTSETISADTRVGIIGITGMICDATAIILASIIVTRIL